MGCIMKVTLSFRNTTAFVALLFVMHELHEIIHITVGRLICGCWGGRDFNVWELCENCSEAIPFSVFATFAGPIFTFGFIYLGYYLMSKKFMSKPGTISLGFALVFANMPFARILTATMGGGDEVYGLSVIFGNRVNDTVIWITGLMIVLLIALPPLVRAWKILRKRHRIWIYAGFFFLPLAFDLLVVLGLMNTLLQNNLLDQPGIIGSPVLVNIWTFFWVIILVLFWTELKTVLTPAEKNNRKQVDP